MNDIQKSAIICIQKFVADTKTITVTMPKKSKPPTPWEMAKPILYKDYTEGFISDSMKPSDVWKLRSVYWNVNYNNFRGNFAAMKRTVKKKKPGRRR